MICPELSTRFMKSSVAEGPTNSVSRTYGRSSGLVATLCRRAIVMDSLCTSIPR
jgi:hypothetical protein